jgi:hypothetical protein
MSLPKKEELVEELRAFILGEYERMTRELEEEARQIENKYVSKVREILQKVSAPTLS